MATVSFTSNTNNSISVLKRCHFFFLKKQILSFSTVRFGWRALAPPLTGISIHSSKSLQKNSPARISFSIDHTATQNSILPAGWAQKRFSEIMVQNTPKNFDGRKYNSEGGRLFVLALFILVSPQLRALFSGKRAENAIS